MTFDFAAVPCNGQAIEYVSSLLLRDQVLGYPDLGRLRARFNPQQGVGTRYQGCIDAQRFIRFTARLGEHAAGESERGQVGLHLKQRLCRCELPRGYKVLIFAEN